MKAYFLIPVIALATLLVSANSYTPALQDCFDEFGNPIECPTEEPGSSGCVDDKGNPAPCPTKEGGGGGGGGTGGGGRNPTPTPGGSVGSVPAPFIYSLFTTTPEIKEGDCAEINWDVKNAQSVTISDAYIGVLTVEPQAAMKVCPPTTTTLVLTAFGFPGAKPSSSSFGIVITVTPSSVQDPCTGFNLGPNQLVIDFEDAPIGTLGSFYGNRYGIQFLAGSSAVPSMGAHSGEKGVISPFGDMGSYTSPIQAVLRNSFQKVGMFVGRQTPSEYAEGEVTAILSGQVYGITGNFIGVVSDTEVLPDSALPISRCMLIDAGDGNVLRNFTLEYQNADGQSSWDPRWMDDLTVLPALASQDMPPVVTILTPSDGATLMQSTLGLTANIIEDIGLRSVEYEISSNGISQPMDFGRSSAASDARLYLASSNLDLVLNGVTPFIDGVITVTATDTAGQRGVAYVTFRHWPVSELDLEVMKVEVTQVIQSLNPDNTVPLVVGKPAIVRVYGRILRGAASLSGISGALCLGSTGVNGCASPIGPVRVIEVRNSATVENTRPFLNLTLDFVVPQSWYSRPGGLTVTGYLNYRGENVAECCMQNNYRSATLNVVRGGDLNVSFVPVRANGFSSDLRDLAPLVDYVSKVYPISGVNIISSYGRVASGNYAFDIYSGVNQGCPAGWNVLLSDLGLHRAGIANYGVHYYGMVDTNSIVDTDGDGSIATGCGQTPGGLAGGIVKDPDGPRTAAQEIAHNLGRDHAPGSGAGNPDPNFPTPDGSLDEWGIDVQRFLLYPPRSSFFDYMGYSGGPESTWTSMYTYRALMGRFGTASLYDRFAHFASLNQLQGEYVEQLLGAGQVSPELASFDYGFTHAPFPVGISDELDEGPYTFALLDSSGTVLYSRTFAPYHGSNAEHSDSGSFLIFAPWAEEAQTIVINYQGTEIGRVERSPNAPKFDLLTPVGGEHWDATGEQVISWAGEDSDGDPLTYIVQHSADGGQTWNTVAANLREQSVTIDAATIAGSDQALVRVIASDGFNSSVAQSRAFFSVDRKPPTVFLTSPAEGYTLEQNWPVILRIFGTDIEDGALPSQAFLWSSSVDGELGAGDQIVTQSLSVGEHTITATGTDSDGNKTSAEVRVTILPSTAGPTRSANELPPFSESFKRTLLIVGIVLAILLAGLIFFLRKRKASN